MAAGEKDVVGADLTFFGLWSASVEHISAPTASRLRRNELWNAWSEPSVQAVPPLPGWVWNVIRALGYETRSGQIATWIHRPAVAPPYWFGARGDSCLKAAIPITGD